MVEEDENRKRDDDGGKEILQNQNQNLLVLNLYKEIWFAMHKQNTG